MIITIAGCAFATHSFETGSVLLASRFPHSCRTNEVAMVEINEILARMVTAIQSDEFPAGAAIASDLGLDLSRATITTNTGVVAIIGATLAASTGEVGVMGASVPRRTLDFVFLGSAIPVAPYIDTPAGVDQRVEQSMHDKGLTISFRIDGFDCGITASARDGDIETLFCAAQAVMANQTIAPSLIQARRNIAD